MNINELAQAHEHTTRFMQRISEVLKSRGKAFTEENTIAYLERLGYRDRINRDVVRAYFLSRPGAK